MVSLKQRNEIYDPFRKKWVENTPEETVRQSFAKKMLEKGGYPFAYMAIEKELSHLPHLQNTSENIPKRRADIVVFAKHIHPHFELFPLLLIECKIAPLNEAFIRQVVGYNAFVQAPFIALTNGSQTITGKYVKEEILFEPEMPNFCSLLESYSRQKCSG